MLPNLNVVVVFIDVSPSMSQASSYVLEGLFLV
jgi:hypothetical protein